MAYYLLADNRRRMPSSAYLNEVMTEVTDANMQYPSGTGQRYSSTVLCCEIGVKVVCLWPALLGVFEVLLLFRAQLWLGWIFELLPLLAGLLGSGGACLPALLNCRHLHPPALPCPTRRHDDNQPQELQPTEAGGAAGG